MPTPIRVLILEDRSADAELMVEELSRGGFDPVWQRVDTEPDYLAGLETAPGVILADYHLPQFDALRALDLMRERGLDIPFIVVSGAIGEDLAVAAMRRGAADYLLKDRLVRLAPAVSHALNEKRLREEKRQAEERYRELFESAVEGVFQITPQWRVLLVNPALARMFGYSSPEEVTASVQDLARRFADSERCAEFVRRLEESGSVREFKCQVFRKDGSRVWISVNAHTVRDEGGRPARYDGTIVDITELEAAETALLRYQEELRDLAARLISAQEMESKRLARELHDGFSQKLAVLGIEVGLLRAKPPASPGLLNERLTRISEQISELATGVFLTARRLHPAALYDLGLRTALENECAAFTALHKVPVKLRTRTLPARLPDDVSLCLYRIAQESLWNIQKHAGAREVRVTVRGGGGEIVLAVEDDGRGFVREAVRGKGGLGLVNIEERVRLVSGHLSISPRRGGGTRVEVRIPSVQVDEPAQTVPQRNGSIRAGTNSTPGPGWVGMDI